MPVPPFRGYYSPGGKRLLDLAVVLPGLVLLAPLMLATATAVRMSVGSPVLFMQVRSGRAEVPFRMYKFRSMRPERYPDEPDTPRLTRVGLFIRRTSLDELPGLWNVLRGDMSLVGPRPLLPRYLPCYTARERRRFEVPPGLTGLAQVSGRNFLGWDRKLALDVEYVERVGLAADLALLARTAFKVLSAADVAPDSEGVEEFLDVERERAIATSGPCVGTRPLEGD